MGAPDARQVAGSAGGRQPVVENGGVAISVFKGRESQQESAATVFCEVGVLTTTPRLDDSLGTLVALVYFGQRTQQSQQRCVGRQPGDQAPAPRNPPPVEPLRMPVSPKPWECVPSQESG